MKEVLKHSTVESVTVIEIDAELVELLQAHMPSFFKCEELVGRAKNCIEDELVNVVYEDGE